MRGAGDVAGSLRRLLHARLLHLPGREHRTETLPGLQQVLVVLSAPDVQDDAGAEVRAPEVGDRRPVPADRRGEVLPGEVEARVAVAGWRKSVCPSRWTSPCGPRRASGSPAPTSRLQSQPSTSGAHPSPSSCSSRAARR